MNDRGGSAQRSDPVDALILDLLEWIHARPRLYSEVLEVWRTSCPRLPVWEESNERGFLDHRVDAGKTYVVVSERGNEFLALNRRAAPRAAASTREGASITPAAAESWLQRYGEAWRRRSPDLAAALFAEDCRYFETPFDEPAMGRQGVRDYWQAVPEGQTDIDFEARVVGVFAQIVVAHWTAAFTRIASSTRVELDGVFTLEFNDDGLCSALREWWHRRETARGA